MKVLELMKTHIIKTGPEFTLADAVDMMDLYQLTSLPVVDGEGALLGVLTESDIVTALLPEWTVAPGKDAISNHMRVPAISVDEGSEVRDAAALMLDKDFERLPVTSEGRLVGVVNRIDVCQALLEGHID